MSVTTWIPHVVATLLFLLGGLCVLLVVVQLPGTWILLAAALLVELGDGLYAADGTESIGWRTLAVALGLALLGELVEFVAGAVGVRQGGGTRRGVWGSILGGLAGFVLFTPLLAFVPFFGAFVGVLLGTFAGAFIGEVTGVRAQGSGALKPAVWATLGRIAGTMGKVAIATAIWIVLSVSAFARL
jgi:uncharacterized protein YqgC (DUF456 family)